MKFKALTLALGLICAQSALATAKLEKPDVCPMVPAIKAVGISTVEMSQAGWVGINYRNHYDTPQEWTFGIFGFQAKDKAEALKKANESISLLMLVQGPEKGTDSSEEWGCVYMDSQKNPTLLAVAITPPPKGIPELASWVKK